jgi:hypothetical protein
MPGQEGEETRWLTDGGFFVHNHELTPEAVEREVARADAVSQNMSTIVRLRAEHVSSGAVARLVNAVSLPGAAGVLARDVSNAWREGENSWSVCLRAINDLFSGGSVNGVVSTFGENGELRDILWTVRGAIRMFATFPFVISVDSTYQTNRYGLPLLLYTSVDTFGLSFCLGGGLLHDETVESFARAFRNLREALGEATANSVQCILTDEDQAEMTALRVVFPGALNRLCLWHLQQHFFSSGFGRLSESSKRLANAELHALLRSESEEEFESVMVRVMSDDRLSSIQSQFEKLNRRRQHWAAPWVSQRTTLGMSTTSRSESENSRIKTKIRGQSQLHDVISITVQELSDYIRERRFREWRQFRTDPVGGDDLSLSVRKLIPPYFSKHCLSELSRAETSEWACHAEGHEGWCITTPRRTYHVCRSSSERPTMQCDCSVFRTFILPCAHIFRVLRTVGQSLTRADVLECWSRGVDDLDVEAAQVQVVSLPTPCVDLSVATATPAGGEPQIESDLSEKIMEMWNEFKTARRMVSNDIVAVVKLTRGLRKLVEEVCADSEIATPPILESSSRASEATASCTVLPPGEHLRRRRGRPRGSANIVAEMTPPGHTDDANVSTAEHDVIAIQHGNQGTLRSKRGRATSGEDELDDEATERQEEDSQEAVKTTGERVCSICKRAGHNAGNRKFHPRRRRR